MITRAIIEILGGKEIKINKQQDDILNCTYYNDKGEKIYYVQSQNSKGGSGAIFHPNIKFVEIDEKIYPKNYLIEFLKSRLKNKEVVYNTKECYYRVGVEGSLSIYVRFYKEDFEKYVKNIFKNE